MATLSEILVSLGNTETTEKTAAAPTDASALSTAVMEAVAAIESPEKTAAAAAPTTPTGDLTKIATRLANAEQEALVKEAELFGAALCDGFVSRMSGYNQAGGGVKTASAHQPETFEKFASENPDLVKQAMDLGYRETREKLAAAAQSAYNEGYTKTAAVIKTAAEHCAKKGYDNTLRVLAGLR